MYQPKTTQNKTLFALIVAMILCFALFFTTGNVAFAATGNVAKIGNQEYSTLADALDQAQDNDTIILIDDVTLTSKLSISKTIILDLNGNVISTDITDVYGTLYVSMNGNLTITDSGNTGAIVNNNGGIVIGNYGSVTIKGGTITTGNDVETDSALYNFYYNGSTYGTSTVEGGTLNGSVWNCGIIDITGGTFTKGLDNSGKMEISGNTVVSGEVIVRDGSDAADLADKGTFEISGGTFENAQVVTVTGSTTGSAPIENYLPAGTVINTDSNGNQVIAQPEDCVAQIGNTKYSSFDAALADAESDLDATVIELLSDVTLATNSNNGKLNVTTDLTINGNGHKITGTQQHMFRIGSEQDNNTTNHDPAKKIEVNLNNLHLLNSYTGSNPRVIETRGGYLELNLNNTTVENAGGGTGAGQAITIGGNQLGGYAVDVNITNSKIIDGQENEKYGYGIIVFNKVNLNVENSEIIGWSALYMKEASSSQGSKGSVVNINNSQIKAINTHSGTTNSFATFVIEDDDITLNIENSTVNASATGDQPQYIVCFQPDFDYSAGTVIEGTQPTGGKVSISGNTVITGIGENDLVVDYRDGNQTEGKAQIVISGGTFDAPIPDEYLADGIVMDGNGNAITFEQKQSNAIAEINEYFNSLSANNIYSVFNTEALNSLKASAIASVTTSVTATGIDNAVATFKTRAAAIPTTTVEKLKEEGIQQINAFYDELVSQTYYFANDLKDLKAAAIATINGAKTPETIANAVQNFEQKAIAIKGIDPDLIALLVSATFAVLVGAMCLVFLLVCKKRGIQIVFGNQPVVEEQPVVSNKKPVKEKVPYQSRAPWVLRELQKQLEEEQAQQSSNEQADEVVATKTAPDFANIASRPSKTFEEKLAESDPEVVANYNLINDKLAQYKNLKARLSKKCQSYRKGRVLVAKVALVGKGIRLYLALDPNQYATSKYHHKDVSDKKSYATTPFMLRVKSKRSTKYALELIEQVATQYNLEK